MLWSLAFTLILLFWQFVPLPLADRNEGYKSPTISIQNFTTKKPLLAPRLFQGVYISPENLKEVLKLDFAEYGIEDQLGMAEDVINCESDWNIFANNGISYGLLQFTPATWKDFGHGDIMNPYNQIKVTASMWSHGFQRRWDCYRILTSKLSSSRISTP